MLRSFSDIESGRITTSPNRSYLETNCNQIFSRTPTVTKEMLQKLQNAEITPRSSVICGYKLHTKQISVILGLFVLCVLSSSLAMILWCTTIYKDTIGNLMVISNNSGPDYERFVNPERGQIRVYLFNYTNVDDYAAGYDDKLIVEEVGPYVYEEEINRFNIDFIEDGRVVRYQQNHTLHFLPLESKGKQSDRVVVPNLPLISAAKKSQSYNIFSRMALSAVFNGLNASPFVKVTADRIIRGYEDNLFRLAKSAMALSSTDVLPDSVGLLTKRQGTSPMIEMYTGKDDITMIGKVRKVDDKSSFGMWSTSECNEIKGSEGVFFNPHAIEKKEPFDLLVHDMCRRLPFTFEKEVTVLNGTIPSYRYTMPANAFGHPDVNNPENQCYCTDNSQCGFHGLYNTTACAYGSPMFVSSPHFLNADPSLLEAVIGLKPDVERHTSFIDILPFGFTTQVWNRLQSNIYVEKTPGLTQLSMFNKDIMLPINWVEVGLNTEMLSDYLKNIMYTIVYVAPSVELILKWASLLMSGFTFLAILLVMKGHCCGKSSIIERSNQLIQ